MKFKLFQSIDKIKNFIKIYLFNKIDTLIAFIGFALGTSIIYFSLKLNRTKLQDIGIIFFIATLTYLLLKNKIITESEISKIKIKKSLIIVNNIVFILMYVITIWMLQSNLYYRPLSYFILISIMSVSIVMDIIYLDKPWVVLFKIILIGINLRGGIFFEFPTIYGVDSWPFDRTIEKYLENNAIIQNVMPWQENTYYYFPISILYDMISQLILSSYARNIHFFSIISFEILSTLFVFLIGRLLDYTKVGLLAGLLLNISDHRLFWSTAFLISSTLGSAFLLIIVYLILKHDKGSNRILNKILVLFFGMILILTHTISVFITIFVLISLFMGKNIYSYIFKIKQLNITSSLVILFCTSMIGYWMWIYYTPSSHLFDILISSFSHALKTDTEFILTNPVTSQYEIESRYETFLSNLGYSIFLGFGIIGFLSWLSPLKRNIYRTSIGFVTLMLFVATYGFKLLSLTSIVPERWFFYSYLFLAILSAEGIFNFTNIARRSRFYTVYIGAIILLIIFPLTFFMITSPVVNDDSPVYAKQNAVRLAYTNSEISSIKFISNTYNNTVYTDPYVVYIYKFLTSKYKKIDFIKISNNGDPNLNGAILLRNYDIDHSIIQNSEGHYILGNELTTQFENPRYKKIYDSNDVDLYLGING